MYSLAPYNTKFEQVMLTASTLSSQTFQTQHEPFENIKHNVKTVQTNKRNFSRLFNVHMYS